VQVTPTSSHVAMYWGIRPSVAGQLMCFRRGQPGGHSTNGSLGHPHHHRPKRGMGAAARSGTGSAAVDAAEGALALHQYCAAAAWTSNRQVRSLRYG